MLPKTLRLNSIEIPTVARKGRLIQLGGLDVRVLPIAATDQISSQDTKLTTDTTLLPKFAVSISVNISKKATVRNRIKRKLHAALIRLNQEGTFAPQRYLLIVRSVELEKLTATEVEAMLKKLR